MKIITMMDVPYIIYYELMAIVCFGIAIFVCRCMIIDWFKNMKFKFKFVKTSNIIGDPNIPTKYLVFINLWNMRIVLMWKYL